MLHPFVRSSDGDVCGTGYRYRVFVIFAALSVGVAAVVVDIAVNY